MRWVTPFFVGLVISSPLRAEVEQCHDETRSLPESIAQLSTLAEALKEPIEIFSPDKKIKIRLRIQNPITYELFVDGKLLVDTSAIAFELLEAGDLTRNPKIQSISKRSVKRTLKNPSQITDSKIRDHFEEVTVRLESGFSFVLRAYNDGLAYQSSTSLKKADKLKAETFSLRPIKNTELFAGVDTCSLNSDGTFDTNCFHSSHENEFVQKQLGEIKNTDVLHTPTVFKTPSASYALLEADVQKNASTWLKKSGDAFVTVSPNQPKSVNDTPDPWGFTLPKATSRENYVSDVAEGETVFPWRALQVFRQDKDMLASNIVDRLTNNGNSMPQRNYEPGFATDEWIIDAKPSVDPQKAGFEPGLNTATYKFYIDFAKERGLKYIIVDAGWSDPMDYSKRNPEMNLEEIIAYGKKNNIGIILWTMQVPLAKNLEKNLDDFKKWGVAGIKVDFMERDDASMNKFVETLADAAEKRKFFVMLHGTTKPTGIHQNHPAIATYEAGRGHEFNKMTNSVTPRHKLDLAFFRTMSGPFDWEGAPMRTAQPESFKIVHENPMGQGTLASQIAPYVFYPSPIQVLAGDLEEYRKHSDVTNFLTKIPTVWDESRALDGKIGEYAIIARRKGNDWYIAGLNNGEAREVEFEIPVANFSGEGIFDTMDSDKDAMSYDVKKISGQSHKIKMRLAKNGGFVFRASTP